MLTASKKKMNKNYFYVQVDIENNHNKLTNTYTNISVTGQRSMMKQKIPFFFLFYKLLYPIANFGQYSLYPESCHER